MARDQRSNRSKNYEDMSRDELVEIIGIDVDPTTDRADLIVMAIEADSSRGDKS
jgi:hypothetical protein